MNMIEGQHWEPEQGCDAFDAFAFDAYPLLHASGIEGSLLSSYEVKLTKIPPKIFQS